MKRGILVGRHKMLPGQERALKELGIQIIKQVEQIDMNRLNEIQDCDVVVVQALPLSLLVQILSPLQRKGIEVLMFEQEAINRDLLPKNEAEKLIREKPDMRTALVALNGNEEKVRVIEFKRVVRIERITIEQTKVWPIE